MPAAFQGMDMLDVIARLAEAGTEPWGGDHAGLRDAAHAALVDARPMACLILTPDGGDTEHESESETRDDPPEREDDGQQGDDRDARED